MHSLPLLQDLVIRTPATHQLREVTSDEDRVRGERAYVIERIPESRQPGAGEVARG